MDKASRCWDGSPETERDKRFFDLRDSGYTGWIDQDGYPSSPEELARRAAALSAEVQ